MSRKFSQQWFEICAVFLTGAGKYLFFEILHLQFWFIMSVSLFWFGYLVFNLVKNKTRVMHWGFRKEGIMESTRLILPLASIAVVLMITFGFVSGSKLLNWNFIPSLVLYPLWGIAQQFLILGLVAGNLQDIRSRIIPKPLIILIASILFCMVHYPNLKLIIATFLLALVYTSIYLRYRNLWTLGILHGWLGSFFYYFILGKDAWMTFINSI